MDTPLSHPGRDEPAGTVTGWVLQLNRASGSSTLMWGPFATMDEAEAWAVEHEIRGAMYWPLYLDVDWMR